MPDRGYDLVYHRLELNAGSGRARHRGHGTHHWFTAWNALDAVIFDLSDDPYRKRSAASGGADTPYAQQTTNLTVELPGTARHGHSIR